MIIKKENYGDRKMQYIDICILFDETVCMSVSTTSDNSMPMKNGLEENSQGVVWPNLWQATLSGICAEEINRSTENRTG
jgi:hypothetical protein